MKFLNNKYLYLLLLWSVCGMFVSCDNDPMDYQAALKPLTDAGPELTFGTNNTRTVTIQPTDPTTDVISVYRGKTDAAATYSIVVLNNDENIFTVPQTVSFEAGANKANITIGFDNAGYDKSYVLKLGLDEAEMDKFSEYTNYIYTCTRIKPIICNEIGKGQWVDEVFWFWNEVTIEKRDDAPIYRIKSPYTKEWLEGDLMEYWSGYNPKYGFGTQTEYLEFTLNEDGSVSWETPVYINLSYNGYDIMGYYPSQLNSSYAGYDEESYARFSDDGQPELFTIVPYWYSAEAKIDWGTDYYWLYLAFPGVDFASEWENQ